MTVKQLVKNLCPSVVWQGIKWVIPRFDLNAAIEDNAVNWEKECGGWMSVLYL